MASPAPSAATMRALRLVRIGLVALMVTWGIATVAGFEPLAAETVVERASGAITVPAVIGAALFGAAAENLSYSAAFIGLTIVVVVALAAVHASRHLARVTQPAR